MDGGEGSVDDLGLDGPKAKAPRRSLQSISPTIVEVDYEGTELKLLGELGTRRVWMELTPGNMKFLFDQVAEEGLGASLWASAASPAKARGTAMRRQARSCQNAWSRPPVLRKSRSCDPGKSGRRC